MLFHSSYCVIFVFSLQVTLPVYLNQTRTELLFTVDMATRGEAAGREHRFYERGVAFLASSLSG